jgi:hypothetical protein
VKRRWEREDATVFNERRTDGRKGARRIKTCGRKTRDAREDGARRKGDEERQRVCVGKKKTQVFYRRRGTENTRKTRGTARKRRGNSGKQADIGEVELAG